MKFAKYHGLGNDYLVMEPAALADREATQLAPRICHRNYGLGSDGLLIGPLPSATADFALRIINPDGSEAEKSGNGLRIFARYLWDTRRVGSAPFRIETKGGVALAQVFAEQAEVRVGMGRASFDSATVGITGPRREVIGEMMEIAGRTLCCTGVSVGNPHCVIIGVPVTEAEARGLGPYVETDARFENRTNVQFLRIIDAANIEIQIWERGAGHTLASGSSASAAAAAAKRLGLSGGRVTVHMPGGQLRVEVDDDYQVTQTGPVTKVADGVLALEMLSEAAGWTHQGQTS